MKLRSLKFQLLKSLALPIVLTMLIIGALGFWSASDEISEVYDSQLITAANVLWLLNKSEHNKDISKIKMEENNIDLGDMDQKALDEYANWRYFRVWKEGKLVVTSDNAQPESIPPSQQGFTNFTWEGEVWRVFALYAPSEKTIVEVAEKHKARSDIAGNILLGLLAPLALALPLIVYLIWQGIHSGLKDLRRFAYDIKKRTSEDLSRVTSENTPSELLPLAGAINHLLLKLEKSLANERLFIDNAAHELRTPLAALTIQTEIVISSKDDNERAEALQELAQGIKRSSKLMEQLLAMANFRQQQVILTPLNLYEQTRQAIKNAVPQVLKKQIDISLSGDQTVQVMSQSILLATLISNIVDNAIKYSPEGGEVEIIVQCIEGHPILIVSDTGPGIPEDERQNVFQRFYRLLDNMQAGSGLGLAIAKQIADILSIEITLLTPENGRGLEVRLSFFRQ